jgi:hypothetical protein
MAKIIKFRRGTTAELSVQSGVEAELFVDTTKDTLVIMDGLTPGGYPLARESQVTSVSSTLTTNYTAAISSNSSIITTNYTSSVSNLSSVLTVNYTAADSSLSSVLTTNYRAADSSLSSLLTTNYTAADNSISSNVSTLSSNTWRAATTTILGLVRADGTSILITSGVISAPSAEIGVGQTWQNVTASRAAGVTYTNTTGRPIYISVSGGGQPNNGTMTLTVDGVVLGQQGFQSIASGRSNATMTAIVPNNSTYVVTNISGWSLVSWAELR